jgi:hypothetical protein
LRYCFIWKDIFKKDTLYETLFAMFFNVFIMNSWWFVIIHNKLRYSSYYKYHCECYYKSLWMPSWKKMKKTLTKTTISREPLSMIVFHNHMKEVKSLGKSSFSLLSTFKNSTFLKKSLFLANLNIVINSANTIFYYK